MRDIRFSRFAAGFLALALLFPPAAFADDSPSVPASNNTDFGRGASAIKSKNWDEAIKYLSSAAKAEPANADAQNLLGYAYRNQRKFELAFKHYGEALRLDPKHKGAHEYMGEAYVLTGDKAKAQEHLAALDRICGKGCEEYQDLAKAIAQAK